MVQILENILCFDIAEQSDLPAHALIDRKIRSAHDDIRPQSHALQRLDAHLGRLGLELARSLQIWDKSNMYDNGITSSDINLKLPDRLQKRLAFYIADGASDLDYRDRNVIRRRLFMESFLDLIVICGMT